jgi:hypothetical protein
VIEMNTFGDSAAVTNYQYSNLRDVREAKGYYELIRYFVVTRSLADNSSP